MSDPNLRPSSLGADGSRNWVVPADVQGRFTRARHLLWGALIAFAVALPLIRIEGRPAIFLDIEARRFFVFGASLNAQDTWLAFFALTALGFGLVVLTTLLGRAWCGWTCPQTVLLEGLYRPIERWLEGPRAARMRRDAGPWTGERAMRKIAKHTLYVIVSLLISHTVLAYFVSLPSLGVMIVEGPLAHLEAFAWSSSLAIVFYANFAWFREQLCLIVCPYGRLQGVLTDDDSLVVGYDVGRGEPRGHRPRGESATDGAARGDCVDCNRCVVVCPTGIDIRHGLQADCIGCSQCIDACDDVMRKVGKPEGLVRYDSLRGLRGEPRRFFRPRLALYAVLGVVGAVVLGFALAHHSPFEATLLRAQGAPFVVDGDTLRNTFEIHLVNKRDEAAVLEIVASSAPALAEIVIAPERVELAALASRRVPVIVRIPTASARSGDQLRLRVSDGEASVELIAPLLVPLSR